MGRSAEERGRREPKKREKRRPPGQASRCGLEPRRKTHGRKGRKEDRQRGEEVLVPIENSHRQIEKPMLETMKKRKTKSVPEKKASRRRKTKK